MTQSKAAILPALVAPKHLRAAGKRLFERTAETYLLEDEHHRAVLVLACEMRDRSELARAVVEKEGLTYVDKAGLIRPRPEVQVQRESATLCLRALRELGLDVREPGEGRPPKITGRASLRVAR